MAKKSKRTKKLQFDIKTRERIIERDGSCIFCAMGYPTKDATWLDLTIKDIMHFIPKSQGGLGIEQNGPLDAGTITVNWTMEMMAQEK